MIHRYKYEILIFLFAILVRIPDLGHDSFNTDVWRWKTRTYNFSNGVFSGDFGLTLQKYHPGVTLMWLGTTGIKAYNLYYDFTVGGEPSADDLQTVFGLNGAQKYFVVLAISFALTSIFYCLRKMFGLKFAVVSMVLLFAEPFYAALAREFHLEGLMSTFMISSIILSFYWFTQEKLNRCILALSAFFASLAVLTKVSALVVVPFIIGAFIVFSYFEKVNAKNAAKNIFLWGLLVATFIFCLWPALWVRPLDVFTAVYNGIFEVGVEGGHAQFYFGRFVQDPGFSFYFVALLLRSSIFLVPGLVGYFIWTHNKVDRNVKKYTLYLLAFSGVYLLPMLISSKKLDRYMLPTLMSLSLVGSVFYYYIIRYYKRVSLSLVALLLLWGIYLGFLHPDYLSYYSPYGGGLSRGIYIIEPKWLIGGKDIQSYLLNDIKKYNRTPFVEEAAFRKIKRRTKLMENKLVVALPEKYYAQAYPFVNETGAWAVVESLSDDAKFADYFIYPVWEDTSSGVTKHQLEYFESIKIRGVPAYSVYKRVGD
jgi:hypothetical protein